MFKHIKPFIQAAGILAVALSLPFAATSAADGKKIYISGDMEGLAGAVTSQQLGPNGFEYNEFRHFYTAEVNAAIDAAFKAGATEILVSDSHGNGQSLLLDELNPKVKLVRSWPRPLGMMEGIDASFDGAIFIGYHASSVNTRGIRAHTESSAQLLFIKLNGIAMSEAGINAAIAGDFDVPVIMISGDDAIAKEATDMLGNIETAVVKWAHSNHSATTLLPAAARALIAEKVTAAVKKSGTFKPYKLKGPITVDIAFQKREKAHLASYISVVERLDAQTIRFMAKDMTEASKFIAVMLSLNAG